MYILLNSNHYDLRKGDLEMKISLATGLCVVVISSILVGCQNSESDEASTEKELNSADSQTNFSDHEHEHSHAHDEKTEIYEGFFDDSQVSNRSLSDWEGDWQSVYPYLQDGTLDEVFDYKAEQDDSKSSEEIKGYYDKGYETNMERIIIQGEKVTFYNGEIEYSGKYINDGYEILTYEAGNRGVRYIFKLVEEGDGLPLFIQFSDHSISPNDSDHFHLYWGDDRTALLEEVTNWPTYYSSELDGHDIAHEMMEH